MSDIPEDIDSAATDAFYLAWDAGHPAPIADAILAERKRCVDIAKLVADMVVGDVFGIANGPDHQQGCKDAGAWILTEIMEPCK